MMVVNEPSSELPAPNGALSEETTREGLPERTREREESLDYKGMHPVTKDK